MKKYWILCAFAGSILFSACNEDRGTTTEVRDSDENENPDINTDMAVNTDTYQMDTMSMGGADSEAMYRDRAARISGQMATDLSLDTTTRSRINEIYYNRSLRLGGLDTKYTTDTTGWAAEKRSIMMDTDKQLKNTLNADQYKMYEGKKMQYDEMKYKSGDTKIKMEGDEMKYKNGDTKIKSENDEMKVKTGDSKMKVETK